MSQVELERLFSVANRVFINKRQSLDPDRGVKQILIKRFLEEWNFLVYIIINKLICPLYFLNPKICS